MTIPSLMSALTQGYNAKQIIGWLANSKKKVSKHIKEALSQGYTDDQILTYLTKGKYASHGERNEMLGGMSEQEKGARIFNAPTDWRKAKTAAKVVGGLAAAIPAARAVRAIPQAIQGLRGLGGTPPPAPSGIGPTPMANAPIQPPNIPNAGQAAIPNPALLPQQGNIQQTQPQASQQTNIAAPQQPPTAQAIPSIPPAQSIQIIDQLGVAPQIENLKKLGNTPEAISTAVSVSMKPGQKKWLDEQIKAGTAKPLPEIIEDYLTQQSTQTTSESTIENKPDISEMGLKEPPVPIKEEHPKFKEFLAPYREEAKKIEKGTVTSLPDGEVGEIKSERNGKALVDIDGKLEQVKVSDLKKPDKSVIQTVEKLLEIPDVDKSGPLSYWSYDPSDKELFVMYHNGETYKYLEVPDDLSKELEEAAVVPKTKGENLFGAWSTEQEPEFSPQAGKNIVSRGATLSKLILQHPKYKKAKKGEPQNPYYRQLRKGYDYWEKLRK